MWVISFSDHFLGPCEHLFILDNRHAIHCVYAFPIPSTLMIPSLLDADHSSLLLVIDIIQTVVAPFQVAMQFKWNNSATIWS